MADMNQIHTFAMKWLDKFRDQGINYIELVDHYMADDCAALGFEMDCGHAFERVYGKAVYDNKELDKVKSSMVNIENVLPNLCSSDNSLTNVSFSKFSGINSSTHKSKKKYPTKHYYLAVSV